MFRNGCRIYVVDITGEKFSTIKVAISHRIYWSGHLSSRKKEDGVKGGGGGDRYFSPLQSSLYYRT